jgi:hypothetical protein
MSYEPAVYVATEPLIYAGRELPAGATVTQGHPARRGLPEAFEPLADDDERAQKLHRELRLRQAQVEELDQLAAEQQMNEKRRARAHTSEQAFWAESARLLQELESNDQPDRIGAWLEEEEREEIATEMRLERLGRLHDRSEDGFWDESIELAQRAAAEQIFPTPVKRETDDWLEW